jgi:hypothetical protein
MLVGALIKSFVSWSDHAFTIGTVSIPMTAERHTAILRADHDQHSAPRPGAAAGGGWAP